MNCGHANWEPIPGWHGRYRCPECGVIAYKPRVIGTPKRGPRMTIYICGVRGCKNGAVCKELVGMEKQWRCAEHRKDQEKP